MNKTSYENEFLNIIHKFVVSELSPSLFCNIFTKLWMRKNDEVYSQAQTWTERHDLQLIQKLQDGQISKEEFGKQWVLLWGDMLDVCLDEMVDTIHSACSVFNAIPEFEWEINEEKLRQEVMAATTKFKECRQVAQSDNKVVDS